jgi:hypothetical protein
MSVLTFDDADKFIITTKKNLLTNPDNSWVNRYEAQALTAGSAGQLLTLGLAIIAFEKLLHAPVVRFSQLSISTWEPDSKPYDPLAFISTPLSEVGGRTKAQDLISLNQTWGVLRVAATGRFGHLFLRGCLYEDDITAPAGKSIFSNLTAISSDLAAAVTTSGLEDYLGQDASGALRLVMINKNGTQIRALAGLSTGGVSAVPQDHAWFNRTTPAAP